MNNILVNAMCVLVILITIVIVLILINKEDS